MLYDRQIAFIILDVSVKQKRAMCISTVASIDSQFVSLLLCTNKVALGMDTVQEAEMQLPCK